MTLDIESALNEIEAQLVDQNRRLAEVTDGLNSLPDGLSLRLDDDWSEEFERATEARQAPSPIPRLPYLRV